MPRPNHIRDMLKRHRQRRWRHQKPKTQYKMEPREMKNPFKSKTLWGIVIAAIGVIAKLFKVNVDTDELKGLVGFLDANWETIAQFIGIVLAVWGRFKAEQPLSFKVPVIIGVIGLFLLGCVQTSALAGEEDMSWVIEDSTNLPTVPSFYAEGYTVGLFPTGGNRNWLTEEKFPNTLGGGMSFGYRFHDLTAVSVGGQWFYERGITFQQYAVDLILFLPHEAGEVAEVELLPDFIKMPFFAETRIYLMIGGGVQAAGNDWQSLIRAGVGMEMPLKEGSKIRYFIDGYWNVVGIGTSTDMQPYATARTGVRIPF